MLKQWDGKCDKFIYKDAKSNKLLIDELGNIYWASCEGLQYLWCSKKRLKWHLLRLWQICGENAVININYRIGKDGKQIVTTANDQQL